MMKYCLNLILFVLIGLQMAHANNKTYNHYIDLSIDFSTSLVNLSEEHKDILHIFSHGQPGQLYIEGKWRTAIEIRDFIKDSYNLLQFTAIHIYGCNFGQGLLGQLAVDYLEHHLGLPVAASNNTTGKDGDWNLEVGRLWKNTMIDYPSNLQICTGNQYKVFGIEAGDRIYGWTSLSSGPTLIGELFPDTYKALNHLATDNDRCRLLIAANIRLADLYYYSLYSDNKGVLASDYLAFLGTSTGGADYHNHSYYFFDDESSSNTGLYEIKFDPDDLSETAAPIGPPTKIADVGGDDRPATLGDIAIDPRSNTLYVLETYNPMVEGEDGELFKLNLSNPAAGWDLVGPVRLDTGTITSQIFIDDQGRLLTSNRTTRKWVELSKTNGSVIQEFGNASSTFWIDFSPSSGYEFLPIELEYFTGAYHNSAIEFEWVTFNETNNKEFIIQESLDGIHFADLVKIQGKGYSHSKSKYNHSHNNPPFAKQLYYRLKSIDFDGKENYSSVITIDLNDRLKNQIKVYPSVLGADRSLTIESNDQYVQKFKIFNHLGLEVPININTMHAGQRQSLSLHNLPTGLYYLIFEKGHVHKFLIQ